MIDPKLISEGIHHCATEGNSCGDCPIAIFCDYGAFEPELIKAIDSMLFSQQESKNHLLEEMNACFNEIIDQYMKDHPERIAKPAITMKLCIAEKGDKPMSERCVCCGKEIPEGRQVCPVCESGKRQNMPYLKPCPFCGGKASLFSFEQPDGSITYEVDCENDDCEVSVCTAMHDTPEEAAAVWNRRGGCRCHPMAPDDEKLFSGLIEEE